MVSGRFPLYACGMRVNIKRWKWPGRSAIGESDGGYASRRLARGASIIPRGGDDGSQGGAGIHECRGHALDYHVS